jgi:hypothetical protein
MRRAVRSVTWAALLLGATGAVDGADRLQLAGVEGSHDVQAGIAVLREAYRRLDMEIEIRVLPAHLALVQANSGMVDGEVQRIASAARTSTWYRSRFP